MGKTVDVYGFPYLVSADVVKTVLEGYTGVVGSIEALEVRQKRAGDRAYARVQFTTKDHMECILNLANSRQLWYDGRSYLKAWKRDIDLVQKPRQFAFEMEGATLHFGCQVSKTSLSVLYEMGNASVKFGFGLRKLYFGVSEFMTSYKLQLSYENIWQVQLHCPLGVSARFLVIQLYGAPRIYQKVEDNPYNFYTELSDDQWVRATDFTPSFAIGQSSHLCIELPHDVELPDLGCYFPYYEESNHPFNLVTGHNLSKNTDLVPIVGPTQGYYLPFDIVFKICALVQHGCIPGPVLNDDFYVLLDPQRRDIESIEYVMEKLYFLKVCCYDPVRFIIEEYRKNKKLRSPTISLDTGLVYVRRVQITPSKVYFWGPEVNVSNRVLRHYADYIDNFLRVSFVDEELEKLYSTDLSPRVGQSGLRDNSAWMFASTGRVNAAEIRNWMGDFRSIKNVAKYAARLGQCFGSSKESLSVARYKPNSEPFLSMMLQVFRATKLLELRTKTRIFVPKGRAMMGCLDETRTLEYGQVFVQYSSAGRRPLGDEYSGIGSYRPRIVRGDVVVAKNPCLHPGDVRVLKAVNVPALHHMVDCVVFPQKGKRPHPNECSGSDLDGDIYFVCWDPDLIPPMQFEPMDYNPAPSMQLDHDVTIEEVEEYFTNYIVNDSLGKISNAHTVFADREPTKAMAEPCVELAKLFSIAVDFPKTGVPAEMPSNLRPKEYPDFMEKPDKTTYESQNVIGKLFREVKHIDPKNSPITPFTKEVARQTYDADMEVLGFEDYTDEAFDFKTYYDNKLGSLMDYYGIKTEAELLTGSIMKMSRSFDRRNDAEAVGLAVKSLRKEARNWFKSGGGDRDTEDDNVYAKASAWYHVTYHPEYWGRYDAGYDEGKPRHFLSFPWSIHDKLIEIKQRKASIRRHVDYDLLSHQFDTAFNPF
ncbi:putative RNA-directed RNA polymerase [Helianthus annuus]|nr:putative RNA-directed RNA polymerase [Helianthus annuus]